MSDTAKVRGTGSGMVAVERRNDRISYTSLVMRVCEDWLLVEPGMPAATGTFDGEHQGAGRRKTRAKTMDGKRKERFPGKVFSYISSFPSPQNLANSART